MAEVELWKEFKNQSGAFRTSLGRQDEEPDRSPAGSILSAKAGYVKINLKSSLDVPLCPNTIVSRMDVSIFQINQPARFDQFLNCEFSINRFFLSSKEKDKLRIKTR